MTEGAATGRSNESSRCRTRPRSWPRTLAISPPSSSLERDFCRRRLAHQKGPEDDVSGQRPEIGDQHTRERTAKTPFLLASYQLRVSQDCVVGKPGLGRCAGLFHKLEGGRCSLRRDAASTPRTLFPTGAAMLKVGLIILYRNQLRSWAKGGSNAKIQVRC
jgi:hypothetical protein